MVMLEHPIDDAWKGKHGSKAQAVMLSKFTLFPRASVVDSFLVLGKNGTNERSFIKI
jgi:hypothetical protein